MKRDLEAFSQPFDLLVIGAGIHGACIARLAALAGLRVALVDKDDFGTATSRNSAKLLHGGLRYMQDFDVPRIRESMISQRAWFRFVPHLVRPLRFVIPTYGYTTRSPAAMAAGIVAFHMIAAGRNSGIRPEVRLPRSGVMSRRRLIERYPMLERGDVTGGAYWYDGQMLDAVRVTLECVWDAVEAGAVAANHLECVSLLHGSGGVVGAVTRDKLTGRELEIRARVTINATGPWVDRVLALGPAAVHGERTTMWSRHINLVTRGLYPGDDALGVASQRESDAALGQAKRLFFTSPWHGLTVVGTTEHLYEGHPDAVAAPDDVVAGFLHEVNAAAPGFELKASDVYSVHLGLTPAEDTKSERAKRSLIVDHEAVHGVPGLISVAGIKYTTAPVVAAKVLDAACRRLRVSPTVPAFERPAAAAPVEDLARLVAEQDESVGQDGHELAWARRIYGTRAAAWLNESIPAGLDPAENVFRSRVTYGASDEMIVRLADALLRATDWAERGLLTETQLTWCADTLQAAHGWTSERKQSELADARATLARLRVRLR